jgi:hypothetical protein
VGNLTLLSGTLSLLEDHHYWVNVAINIGNYNMVSSSKSLSTFDVQDIDVLNSINGLLCMRIKYISGAIGDGCHVELNCSDYENLIINGDINGITDCINHDHSIDGETTCSLIGYDRVNGMIENQNGPAVVEDDVTISGEPIMSTEPSQINLSGVSSTVSFEDDSLTIIISWVIVSLVIVIVILLILIVIGIMVMVIINNKVTLNYSLLVTYRKS